MTVSAANPQEMRDYMTATSASREDASAARDAFITAYEELVAALPAGFSAPARPNIAGPLGRCRDVDAYVGEVAQRFEEAGSVGEGGVFTMDSSLLASIPYTSVYGEELRARLRRRAEEELARLRENLRSGGPDETSLEEAMAILGWMAFEVGKAQGTDAQQAVAEDLIDTMGAGDLDALLDLFGDALDDGANPAEIEHYLGQLGTVVSLGLEDQPRRAEAWVETVSGRHDWYHDGADEMLIALGAMTAAGTTTLGAAVWRELWNHTYIDTDQGTVYAGQHVGAQGRLEKLFGTDNGIEVMADAAADRPELANEIVMHTIGQGFEDFEHLFAQGGTQNPSLGGDGTYDALGEMLTASVHPSLPLEDRMLAASQTITMYDHALDEGPVYTYPAPIREGLGTMAQPLLANLYPSDDVIQLPGLPATDGANQSVAALENVIRDLTGNDAGIRGIAAAVEGATSELLAESRRESSAAGMAEPLDVVTLHRTGEMMDWVVGVTSNERVQDLVSAVEGGGLDAAMQTALLDGIGATPAEPAAVVANTVLAAGGEDVVASGNVLGRDPEDRLTYQLVLLNLDAWGDSVSPELVEGLQRAADPEQPGAPRGADGISLFLQDVGSFTDAEYPGLHELRQRVMTQTTAIGGDASSLLAEVFSGVSSD